MWERYDFKKLYMLESKNILKYFVRVLTIYNQIKRYGEKMRETCVVEKILRSLQKKFHYIMVAIEESQNIDVLLIQSLMGKLQVHEEKVNKI